MFIVINGEYLNPIAISRITETDKESVIHLANGEKVRTDESPDGITIEAGAVIGANPGFEAAWLDSAGKVDKEIIAAWRVTGHDDPMIPMVPSGREGWDAVIYPCGRVRDRDGRFFADVDTWSAALFEQAERKAKAVEKVSETV